MAKDGLPYREVVPGALLMQTAGPCGVTWTPPCTGEWVESPIFQVEARYLRLSVLDNNGYEAGCRAPRTLSCRPGNEGA